MILLTSIIIGLFVNGLNIATDTGMIFERVRVWLQKKIGHLKIYKPILGCIKCMPSIYGTLICLYLYPFTPELFISIPITIVCSSAVAAVIHQNYI